MEQDKNEVSFVISNKEIKKCDDITIKYKNDLEELRERIEWAQIW